MNFKFVVFLLCFSSTGICNANFDYTNRFRTGQEVSSEDSKSESPNTLTYNNFIVGTIGLHTLFGGRAFGGLTGHLGGRVENKGFGILSSYEIGQIESEGFEITAQVINISAAASYKLGDATILVALGGTGGSLSLDDFDIEGEFYGITSSFSYLYQPDNKFTLMLQGRLQGKGIMLSAGIGF